MAYISLSTDFAEIPWLGTLPLSPIDAVKTYDVSQYVPSDTTEILIYAFATVGDAMGKGRRVVYEFYTEDPDNVHYSQLMNMAFIENEYVLNSANMWFPIYDHRQLNVNIPGEWPLQVQESSALQAFRTRRAKGGPKLSDVLKDYHSGGNDMYADIYLLGYRTSGSHKHAKKTQA